VKLEDKINVISGIGTKRAEMYNKLGIFTVKDLLYHFPRGYLDYTSPVPVMETKPDENSVVCVRIDKKMRPAFIRKGMTIYRVTASDESGTILITIYNSEYLYNSLETDKEYILYGKITGNLLHREITSPYVLKADEECKIQPVYPLTEGLTQQMLRVTVKKALKALDNEIFEPIPKKYLLKNNLSSLVYSLSNIHFPKDTEALTLAKNRLVFDELLVLQLGMSLIKNHSHTETGCVMKNLPVDEFYKSLPFELTNAQKRSIDECVGDMHKNTSMNRLVQGDVGSGKTVVAAACSYFAYKNGYQTALMAPTEILAAQHYETLKNFLEPLGLNVCLLTGSTTIKNKNEIKRRLVEGKYHVAVGTHALIQSTTEFENLGLVITDEQHRFGVEQRALLSNKGNNPHRLVMSATPIPRTLALMIYGDLDISVIDELPKGRKPIMTYAVTGKLRERAYSFTKEQLDEGRQAYVVCPMIEEGELDLKSVEKYAKEISTKQFKNYRVGLLHGKMPSDKKDKIMLDFKEHKIDLLVCTTVVEVGVDVANATVMIIENAERFGLSQLHQLRGRVGRGEYQSHCILVTDNVTEDSKNRLKILSKTNDGFRISEEDLKLRGPGDFFGQRQHGLPSLKIADMAENTKALNIAQSCAKEILSDDNKLSKNENSQLRKLVDELFDKKIDLN